jgi:hypothetical protein
MQGLDVVEICWKIRRYEAKALVRRPEAAPLHRMGTIGVAFLVDVETLVTVAYLQ